MNSCSCGFGTGHAERVLEDGRIIRFCRGCAAIVEIRERTPEEQLEAAASLFRSGHRRQADKMLTEALERIDQGERTDLRPLVVVMPDVIHVAES